MKFCDYCGRRISLEEYDNNKKCSKCDNKQDGTTVQATVPKVITSIPKVTPLPPEQVDSTKPTPTSKELIPYLEEIAKYKQTDNQVLTPTNSQRKIIKKIEDCIRKNRTRIVISAPTGSGKSWIAATLANAYDIVILTSTNDLQDQYCGTEDGTPGDFNFMNAVRGKGQYLCEESGNTKYCNEAYCTGCDYLVYDEHVQIGNGGPLHEQKIFSKPEDELCKYFKADMIGKKSKYSVYSYASYIARMKAEKFKMEHEVKLPDRTVLVCDEAHDYDEKVSEQLSVEIDGALNQKIAGKSLPNFSGEESDKEKIEKTARFVKEILERFESYVDNAKVCAKHSMRLSSKKHLRMHQDLKCGKHSKHDVGCDLCKGWEEFLDEGCLQCKEHLELVDDCTQNHVNVLKNVNRYTLYIQNLKFLLPGLTEYPDNYIITDIKSNKFTVAPLKTTWFTKQLLEKFNLCIFMSATINNTIISKETGISEDTFEFIDQPSEIPKENRQIKFENTYWYKKEDDWNVVINKIKDIFDNHPDERGLIICTSYYQIKNILERFEKNYHDDYTRLTNDEKGSKFKNTLSDNMKKSNGVIISAKIGTGVDLKNDASRFQIIIKAPFVTELADENNERAKRIQREDTDRYFIKSMFRLVQFAGRSVRNNNDHAVTYVLDEPAQYLVKWNGKKKPGVPDWFYDACQFQI